MNLNSIIPLAAGLAYIPLLCILILNSKWQKNHKLFALYLISAMVWSISDFFLRSDFLLSHKVVLFQIVISSMIWVLAQYYHFIKSYLYGSPDWIQRLTYVLVAIFAIGSILGSMPHSLTFYNGRSIP
jgi:hypothetical protein